MATYDVGNRSAIVTGGGSGIGAACAEVLASSGAAVLVVDLDEANAQAVTKGITEQGGTATALAGDVSDEAFAQVMVDEAGKMGPLRIAVNNAGIGGLLAHVADLSTEDWRKVMAVNLDAVFTGCGRRSRP
jgi:NAD(P)-dependent dehydrogenase (short-subunit alcohol dehydrogenase family)